jgi:HAD superfamily hydrolase (TIGR01509 family)
MQYQGIVFDCFGVICTEIAAVWLPRYMSPAAAAEVKSRLFGAADRGDVSQDALLDQLGALVGLSPSTVESEWNACAVIDDRLVALVERLGARYRVALLTNATAPFVRELLSRYDLGRLFRVVVVSGERRIAKPDRRIYELTLSEMGLPAAETLLIDDNPANVDGARTVGMDGIVYQSVEDLEAELALRGIL